MGAGFSRGGGARPANRAMDELLYTEQNGAAAHAHAHAAHAHAAHAHAAHAHAAHAAHAHAPHAHAAYTRTRTPPPPPKRIEVPVSAVTMPYEDALFQVNEDGDIVPLRPPERGEMLCVSLGPIRVYVDASGRMVLDASLGRGGESAHDDDEDAETPEVHTQAYARYAHDAHVATVMEHVEMGACGDCEPKGAASQPAGARTHDVVLHENGHAPSLAV